MNVHQLKDLSPEDRLVTLEGECFKVEEQSYLKPLTEAELADRRTEFSQTSIEISVIDDERKEAMAGFKDRIDPLKVKKDAALTAIKHRGEMTKGKVYLMPDHENRVMHVVTPEGLVLDSRMMRPEERQFTIQHNQKTA